MYVVSSRNQGIVLELMSLSRLLALTIPNAFAKAKFYASEFERLGIARETARRWGQTRKKLCAFGICHAKSFPDQALRDIRSIVDLGSNSGQWIGGMLELCNPNAVILVEPDPRMHASLEKIAHDHKNITLLRMAAGERDGILEFNMTSDPLAAASSALKPIEEMNRYYGFGFDVMKTVSVPVKPLDEITAHLDEVSFLKIDVQGYEMQVLAGAVQTLEKAKLVHMEVCFYHHYEGDTLFPELHERMSEAGFVLANMSEPMVVGGRAMWADATYRHI